MASTWVNPTYRESDAVKKAQELLQQQMANKPGAYQSKWQGQIDSALDKLLNREKFNYDLAGDALYKQYRDRYVTQGKQAMMDTMGQAQAMTGGYGNSYAQTVGQQTYQGYLQGLNDRVPELYNLALQRYQMEGDQMAQRLGLLQDQESQSYGRYQDGYNNWLAERDFLQGRYDAERDYDYGKYSDDRDLSYNQWQFNQNYQLQLQQMAQEQARWQAEFDESVRQYNEQMALAQSKSSGGGGGSGGGYGYDTHGMSTAEIKALQRELGVTAYGIWGPNTEAAYQAAYGGGSSAGSKADLTAYLNKEVSLGASKSSISATIRDAQSNGYITAAEAAALRKEFTSRGNTY